jgi:hypothetical protein
MLMSVCIFAVICRHSPAFPAEAAVPPEPRSVQVIIAGQSVTINGTPFSMPASRADIIKVLGEPNRIAPLYNTILTWDELGLYAYEDPKTGGIHEVSIALDREPFKFCPAKLFSGVLRVDGVAVTASSTVEEINRGKTGQLFQWNESMMEWILDGGPDLRLFLHKADPKLKNEKANLASLHIAKKLSK